MAGPAITGCTFLLSKPHTRLHQRAADVGVDAGLMELPAQVWLCRSSRDSSQSSPQGWHLAVWVSLVIVGIDDVCVHKLRGAPLERDSLWRYLVSGDG